MNYYNENIEEIKNQGFESIDFEGYGGTGYKKGELEIWWGEWGNSSLELIRNKKLIKEIPLCNISTEQIKEKLTNALQEINSL